MFARPTAIGWFMLIAVAAFGVHSLKYDAQELRDSNARLQKNIEQERLALHLLDAEWVYLNRPDRLQKLAEKYLPVEPMQAKKVISWDRVPLRPIQQASAMQEVR